MGLRVPSDNAAPWTAPPRAAQLPCCEAGSSDLSAPGVERSSGPAAVPQPRAAPAPVPACGPRRPSVGRPAPSPPTGVSLQRSIRLLSLLVGSSLVSSAAFTGPITIHRSNRSYDYRGTESLETLVSLVQTGSGYYVSSPSTLENQVTADSQYLDLYVCIPSAGTWQLNILGDFGYGAGLWVDSVRVDSIAGEASRIPLQANISTPGLHHIQSVGFELCCNANRSSWFYRPGSTTPEYISTSNIASQTCNVDADRDGVTDATDNCPTVANANQANGDGGTAGDACEDTDGDGVVDASDICPVDNPNDGDVDGYCASEDNCPTADNADQADFDDDTIGDVCDDDWDGDGVADDVDLCLGWSDALDADDDGIPDGPGDGSECDICPIDPQNDADDDTLGDACDNCPDASNVFQKNFDGDSAGDACDDDDDGDSVVDADDAFPFNTSEWADTDGDGTGDNSDVCPTDPLDTDDDYDLVCDVNDTCLGSVENDADADGDQVCDHNDLCWGNDITGDSDEDLVCGDDDNCPVDANADQSDVDIDGIGDVCEADGDQDGTIDDYDNCVSVANVDQADNESDGQGDACDDDDDIDGTGDAADNCAVVANASQVDFDVDGLGDARDGDDDADAVADGSDLCPGTSLASLINAQGCSGTQYIDLTCGTATSWTKHGQYVSCVAHARNAARSAGLITGAQGGTIVSTAAKTSTGKK